MQRSHRHAGPLFIYQLAFHLIPPVHSKPAKGQKLISDAPLEWMNVDGVPLMLRADVSRIAVTPGNLFVQQAISGMEVAIPCKMFTEVLIVRSFQPSDPIKPLLERAIALYAEKSDGFPSIRIVDVRTLKEFEDALNSFQGALLVYDGHGGHQAESDVGYLALSDEKVDPWTLRGNVRIPPIVMLAPKQAYSPGREVGHGV